jgi:cytosine/adenosine deaminase-related metal-dependent hydrolase
LINDPAYKTRLLSGGKDLQVILHYQPADFTRVVDMVFNGGALAMGLNGKIRCLRPGAMADLTIINLHRPHIAPVHSPQSALVNIVNGNDVDTVIVNGEILLQDGKLLVVNEDSLMNDCQKAAEAMLARAGIAKNYLSLKTKVSSRPYADKA